VEQREIVRFMSAV